MNDAELVGIINGADAAAAREALAELARRHKGLILYHANRLQRRFPFVDRDDLIQCGYYGLVRYARDFEADRYPRFSLFINTVIKHAMGDWLRAKLKVQWRGVVTTAADLDRRSIDDNGPASVADRLDAAALLALVPAKYQGLVRAYFGLGVEARPMARQAADLGVCPSSVRAKIERAFRAVRKRLGKSQCALFD